MALTFASIALTVVLGSSPVALALLKSLVGP
jgi:hypothetical protein